MIYRLIPFALAALGLLAAGCGDDATRGDTMDVTGELTYRARIALPPDAVMTVRVSDTGRADAAAIPVAELAEATDGAQVPLPFVIPVDTETLETNPHLTLRATIEGADGALLWTTDTVIPVTPPETGPTVDLGPITLVQVAGTADETASATPQGEWMIIDIDGSAPIDGSNPTIALSDDGTISGSTGCNNFTGSFTLDGDQLTLGPLATTRKACVPELGDQEAAILAVLNEASSLSTEPSTATLTISTDSGASISGQR